MWLQYVSYVFGGVFLANAIPHFVSGVMGHRFHSPFADPPGRGFSSAAVNVLWGFLNLVVGYLLICRVGAFSLHSAADAAAMGVGMLVMGLVLARIFSRY